MATKTRKKTKPGAEFSVQARVRDENLRAFVPALDFNAVAHGQKTEWRIYGRVRVEHPCPRPLVLYTKKPAGDGIRTALVTLEEVWEEPMGAISPASLAREGFNEWEEHRDNLAAFRQYVIERYPRGGFRPNAMVICRRVHPITDEEREFFGRQMFERMYGQWA